MINIIVATDEDLLIGKIHEMECLGMFRKIYNILRQRL